MNPSDGSTRSETSEVFLSVVVPLYNESENVFSLCDALMPVLRNQSKSFEVILVDDGSKDDTYVKLRELQEKHSEIRVVRFRRNFGQSAALQAGFDLARGDVIVTLDGDLQNDPKDIPRLLDKLDEGFDIVSGRRADRKENFVRVLPSKLANWMLRKVTKLPLHDSGCTLKAYRKEAIEPIRLYGEQHRFIPALASQYGATVTEMNVHHRPRTAGKSKYGLSRTHRVFLDILMLKFLLSYATRPLQAFGFFGLLSFVSGLLISGYLTVRKFQGFPLSERPLLLLGVLLLILGVQFVSMGLLAEMLARTYHESSKRPIYVIRDIL